MKTMKRGENVNISDFILGIGKKIEQVSGAKLNFSEEATVPKEKWIPEEQEKTLLKLGVELRTEKQTKTLEVVELKKFDPCSLNESSKISCRAFRCQQTTPRLCGQSKKHRTKQDLFLCQDDQNDLRLKLTDMISKYFAKQDVKYTPNVKNSSDFKGYTSLIGALEKAFTHLKSKWFKTTTDNLLAEIFLNTRNFLIITNALLNPNEDNVTTALGPYLTAFERILDDPTEMLRENIILLAVAMHLILQFYGIFYRWAHVLLENPGAKVGFGVGLIVVVLAIWLFDNVSLSFCLLFLFATSLIGNGIWDWNSDKPSIERSNQENARLDHEFLSRILPNVLQFIALPDTFGNLRLTATNQ